MKFEISKWYQMVIGLTGVLLVLWLALPPVLAGLSTNAPQVSQAAAQPGIKMQAATAPTPSNTAAIPNTGAGAANPQNVAAFGLYLFLALLVLGITATLLVLDDHSPP